MSMGAGERVTRRIGMRRNVFHLAWSIAVMSALFPGARVFAAGTVLHVDDDADPGGEGLTWPDAFRFLQDALVVAAAGGVSEIRVAQGTYLPDRSEDDPNGTGDRGATFALLTGVGLRGGYAGLGEPDPDARDVTANATILSGDLLGDDGPDFEGVEDNSEQVLTAVDIDASGVLDGFTITAGNTCGDGGGMRIEGGGPTVIQCAFVANGAAANAGAISVSAAASPSILLCEFEGNRAGQSGGAVNGTAGAALTMCACSFGGTPQA